MAADVTLAWEAAKLTGKWKVRDLWRHKDLGAFENQLTVPVAAHGAVLVKLVA